MIKQKNLNQKISPCLWFDNNAEEAVNFYLSVFPDSQIENKLKYSEAGPGEKGSILSITFSIKGVKFIALNGGPHFEFTPAISFLIECESQQEIDHYWDKLSAGGVIEQCGWLKDKFGVSWQVVPSSLLQMLQDEDAERVKRVTEALLKMNRIVISDLELAHQGKRFFRLEED